MRLKLNLEGIILYLKISGYVKTTKVDWDAKWCNTEGCIENRQLHLEFHGEILLSSEIDDIVSVLNDLLSDRLTEPKSIELIEPDLSFVLFPKEDIRKNPRVLYVREGCEIMDINGELIFHLYDEDGALSSNSIHLVLCREDIQAILVYFRYVKHELSEQSIEVAKLLEAGILQKEYS